MYECQQQFDDGYFTIPVYECEALLDFYDNVIGPFKGEVEAWYSDKQNLGVYFALIFLTVWVVIFSKSDLIWRVFKDLPVPPDNLKDDLNFPR